MRGPKSSKRQSGHNEIRPRTPASHQKIHGLLE